MAESPQLGSSSIGLTDQSDEMVTKRGQGHLGDEVRIVGGGELWDAYIAEPHRSRSATIGAVVVRSATISGRRVVTET